LFKQFSESWLLSIKRRSVGRIKQVDRAGDLEERQRGCSEESKDGFGELHHPNPSVLSL